MKIAQIVCSFRPYIGGIGEVAYYYTKVLEDLGHKVTVFSPNYKGNKDSKDELDVKRLNTPIKFGNAAFLPQIIKYVRDYDIIHLHYPFFGTAEVLYLLKKIQKKKTKLVLTYHMDVVSKGFKGFLFNFHSKLIMPRIIKSCDKVIVSSYDYIKNSNAKKLFNKYPDKFIEIPFGADPIFKKQEISRYTYKIKEKEKILLFVGGLDDAHYFKGLDNLLNAMSCIDDKDLKLIIVGKGNRLNYFRKIVKQYNLGSRVRFTGYISNEELVKYYNLCNIFILPSIDKSEAFGIVSLQAMACGKPVITSNLPGVRSVVIDNKNGLLVKPNNIEDLIQKIIILKNDPVLQKKFGEEGKKMVEKKYNWDSVGGDLHNLYQVVFRDLQL